MVSVHLEQISEESLWNTDDEERWKSCVLKKKKLRVLRILSGGQSDPVLTLRGGIMTLKEEVSRGANLFIKFQVVCQVLEWI